MFAIQLQDDDQARASPKDQVSMPFIKRHIRRRLTNAKDTCDKELRKVIESITQHVELKLRDGSTPRDTPPLDTPNSFYSTDHAHEEVLVDEADFDPNAGHHSRRMSISASAGSSPNSLRRHHRLPTNQGELSPGKKLPSNTPSSSSASYAQSGISRRLSRNMHIPIMPTRSGDQSRSTSRSRSPLPLSAAEMASSPRSSSSVAHRRSSRFEMENLQLTPDLFMVTLYDVIGIATDIIDTPISKLIAETKLCMVFVQKVQKVGRSWDEHPEWQGRGWYVQLLLAVAGLSRVVEWWEAEKQFWNFEEDDDQEVEPMTFVVKPEDSASSDEKGLGPGDSQVSLASEDDGSDSVSTLDHSSHRGVSSSFSGVHHQVSEVAPAHSDGGPKLLESASRLSSAVPSRNQSRELLTQEAPVTPPEQPKTSPDDINSSPEASRVKATEKLRIQAEQAQSSNIVMELGLERDEFLWVNQAWPEVVGMNWEDLIGTTISELLHPEDVSVFKEATKQLQEDDSHTVEVHFRMRVEPITSPNETDTGSDSTTSAPGSPHRSLSSSLSLNFGRSSHSLNSASLLSRSFNSSPALPTIATTLNKTAPRTLYRAFEGKGMLMLDRVSGNPIHTMWVLKPTSSPGYFDEYAGLPTDGSVLGPGSGTTLGTGPGFHRRVSTEPVTPFITNRPISTTVILCRICECGIPDWFFEKHNETCNEVHKLEASIVECNESINELRSTIREMVTVMDKEKERGFSATGSSSSVNSLSSVPEYRGQAIFSPRSSTASPSMLGISSSLQIFRPPLGASRKKKKLQGVRQLQRLLLDQLDETLCLALEISTPALRDDQHNQPMERQRMLSPNSVDKIELLKAWKKPVTAPTEEDDPALARLVLDVQLLIKAKLESVNRMENTIKYSEKIRQEWEARVELALTQMEMEMEMEDVEEEDEGQGDEDGSHSSTTSEYAYDGVDDQAESIKSSMGPTPVACSPPMPVPLRRAGDSGSGQPSMDSSLGPSATNFSPPVMTASPMPLVSAAVPATYHGIGSYHSHTRSSTPSSLSSPLALAAPIVASNTPESVLFLPPAQTFSPSPPPSTPSPQVTPQHPQKPSTLAGIESSAQTIRARRSGQNLTVLEPRVLVTPPVSPLQSPRESQVIITHSRRQSTMNPIISPTTSNIPAGPLSPRIPSIAPSRPAPSSIKDFDIIKPISKGAFGAVFLAKKKTTGDYFAIKVLKKADMISKNQITNVKAERMILMKQAESPFVVKLFFTFQSKDNLYLVMEYLNGGDCAALIKSLGSLPEEWTKAYVAEVTLGLEYLHERDVVHRDLKPDNLLIDQHGHLKLTDFGLSRIGLLGRQARDRSHPGRPLERVTSIERNNRRHGSASRQTSMDSTYMSSPVIPEAAFPGSGSTSYFNHRSAMGVFSNISTDDISESSGSESLGGYLWPKSGARHADSPLQSFPSELTNDLRSHSHSGSGTPPGEQKFVGTPDYLAPETILGISDDDRAVDWWALGVITYEFLYGLPPFHDETPEKVFENIISLKIDWHEDWVDFEPETMDFMKRLMTTDPKKRLGWNGAQEVKEHPFLADVEWDKVATAEPQFVPHIEDPESTDYFDPRGAIPQLFQDDEPIAVATRAGDSPIDATSVMGREMMGSPNVDDFGTFNFKNLNVLKQANDDVIRKLKTEASVPIAHALSDPVTLHRRRSVSVRKPQNVLTSNVDHRILTNPPSPSTSTSSIASSPSRISLPPSTPGSTSSHNRRPSEYGPVERFKRDHFDGDGTRRNSLPSRLRTSSMSSMEQEQQGSDHWRPQFGTPASSVVSVDIRKADEAAATGQHPQKSPQVERSDRVVTCLIAEDNPISAKIMETLLTRLGCRCVLVHDGAEAISVALGDIKFDCILMDYHMPIMDGETAARYIKNTNNKNKNTPIISVSAYSPPESGNPGSLFSAYVAKPVQKGDLVNIMRQLGFKMIEGAKPKVAR